MKWLSRARGWRLGAVCIAIACTFAALPAVPASIAGASSPPIGVGDPHGSSNAQVTFTPNTIVVTPAQVRSSLVGVSADGSTYTFSSATGPLAKLAPGKVLLLEGFDAAQVTKVTRSGTGLVVTTVPASLPSLIQSGNIDVNTPPDFSGAFGSDVTSDAVASLVRPSLTGGAGRPGEVPALAHAWNYTGKDPTGDLTYSISLSGDSDGLHAYGGFCYSSDGTGNISGTCGGKLSLKGEINGLLSFQTEAAKIAILKGQPPKGSFSLSGFTAKLKLTYVAIRATGSQIGAKLKPFNLPFSFEMPVCPPPAFCGGVPLYTKFEVSLLVTLGISSKNSTMQGGFTVVVAGAGSVVDQTGLKVIAGSAAGFHLSGQFNPGKSITLGASGAEVALQLKVSLGIGIRNLNAMFYLAFIAAIGQTTGSAVAGELCQNYYADFTIKGGIEAQLWIFKIPIAGVTLWSKSESDKQPGC
jgi:hypothetical protein